MHRCTLTILPHYPEGMKGEFGGTGTLLAWKREAEGGIVKQSGEPVLRVTVVWSSQAKGQELK